MGHLQKKNENNSLALIILKKKTKKKRKRKKEKKCIRLGLSWKIRRKKQETKKKANLAWVNGAIGLLAHPPTPEFHFLLVFARKSNYGEGYIEIYIPK